MSDLIVFLSFIIFMLFCTCWIQTIQVERLKEKVLASKNKYDSILIDKNRLMYLLDEHFRDKL